MSAVILRQIDRPPSATSSLPVPPKILLFSCSCKQSSWSIVNPCSQPPSEFTVLEAQNRVQKSPSSSVCLAQWSYTWIISFFFLSSVIFPLARHQKNPVNPTNCNCAPTSNFPTIACACAIEITPSHAGAQNSGSTTSVALPVVCPTYKQDTYCSRKPWTNNVTNASNCNSAWIQIHK